MSETELSLEHRLARLPPEQRAAILDGVDTESLLYDWHYTARPSQILAADNPFSVALVMAGRGFGKTLMGAQWIRELDTRWWQLGRDSEPMRFALLGRTAADVRDVMLEGTSGLMRIWPPSMMHRVVWTPSRRRIELPNGSVGLCFSSEEPDQLRGPAFSVGWADELASYKQIRATSTGGAGDGELTAWENLRIAVRLGEQPQILATTTPKRVPLLRQILREAAEDDSKILLRRGRTMDNVKLSKPYLDTLFGLYGGTRLGAQELEGEMLDDVMGAMTSESTIDAHRMNALPFGVPWIRIIGVDPSVAERPHDECGIVVTYISRTWPVLQRHAFVVDDLSTQASPALWSAKLIQAAFEHQAVVVVEVNQGANLVKQLLRQAAAKTGLPMPPVREVWASKAKSIRAEIVGAAYERGRVHHIGVLADLESQQTSWTADDRYSPDRMDAAVHAVAAGLFPESLVHGAPGTGKLHGVARKQIPTRSQSRRAG